MKEIPCPYRVFPINCSKSMTCDESMGKKNHNYKLPNNNRYRDTIILKYEVNYKIRFTSQLKF